MHAFRTALKRIDLPPLWLLLFVLLARAQATRLPLWPLDHPLTDLVSGLLIGGGVLLMAVALVQLRQNHTTFVPHRHARHMVTNGVFSRTRNPIYLGDTMVLLGFVLHWSAWPSLLLVPLFMWLVTDRFIREEEAWLKADFGPQFELWAANTRRWL